MNCTATRELLSEYLDRVLAEAEDASIQRHLAQCAECRAELEELRKVAGAVRALPRRSAPRGFAAGVMAAIKAETPDALPGRETVQGPVSKRGVLLRFTRRYQGVVQILAGAAAVFLVYMGVTVFTGDPAGVPTGGTTAKESLRFKQPDSTLENLELRGRTAGPDDADRAGAPADAAANGELGKAAKKTGWGDESLDGKVHEAKEAAMRPPQDKAPGEGKKPESLAGAKSKDPVPAEPAPQPAAAKPQNVAFQKITVFSSNVAADARSVQAVLADAGYTYVNAGGANTLMVRVPAKDATRLVAALGDKGADFRMDRKRNADEYAKDKLEERKDAPKAGKNQQDAGDGADHNESADLVAEKEHLEKALRDLDALNKDIERAKLRRVAEKEKSLAKGDAPAKEPLSDEKDGGAGRYGGAGGGVRGGERAEGGGVQDPGSSAGAEPPATGSTAGATEPSAPGGLAAGGRPKAEGGASLKADDQEKKGKADGAELEQDLGEAEESGQTAGEELNRVEPERREARRQVQRESEDARKVEDALKALESQKQEAEETVFIVIEFAESKPAAADPEPTKK